jgi:hypothetical protein
VEDAVQAAPSVPLKPRHWTERMDDRLDVLLRMWRRSAPFRAEGWRLVGEALATLLAWAMQPRWTIWHCVTASALLLAIAPSFLALSERISAQVNIDISAFDQQAVAALARDSAAHPVPTVSDGVRTPLYPWLVSRMVQDGAPGDLNPWFQSGLILNRWLALCGALVTGWIASRVMAWLPTLLISLAGIWAIWLPFSTFALPEVLHFTLTLIALFHLVHLLNRPTLGGYAFAGGLVGLAWLAKPGVLPWVALFFVAVVLREALRFRDPTYFAPPREVPRWVRRFIFFAAAALLVTGPCGFNTWRTFGRPYFNYTGSLMWADDWTSIKDKLPNHAPNRVQTVPADERLTFENYAMRRNVYDALARVRGGVARQWQNLMRPEGDFESRRHSGEPVRLVAENRGGLILWITGLGVTFAVALRRLPREAVTGFTRGSWFLVTAFSATFLAHAWYTPIAPGARFMAAWYLPLLILATATVERLRTRSGIDFTWLGQRARNAAALLYVWFLIGIFSAWLTLGRVTEFDRLKGVF